MQDGIMKGTGNSRYLKSIADFLTQYPTYQEFAAALVAGTLPVDFNGINETGWEQLGTVLNKANLLSDETAEMYRLSGEEAVPNDVLNQIYVMIQMMQVKKAYVSVSVQLSDGTPVGGVQLSNTIKTLDGDIVYTDSAGKASGYVDEGTIVLPIVISITQGFTSIPKAKS